MTLYTIFGILGGIALLITIIRYFLQKPSNLIISFVQYFVACLFIFSGLIKENDTIGFSYKLEEYFEVFKTADSVQVVDETPVMGNDTAFTKAETSGKIDTVISQKQIGTEKNISWKMVPPDSFYNRAMDFFHDHALELGFFILVMEVMLGLMLLIGVWKKITLLFLFLMIAFFTFLTYYSAAYNAVQECGCFGDFLHMTPWQSFGKDILLLVLIIILIIGKKHISPVFAGKIQKVLLAVFLLFSVSFPLYTYNYLPVFDFRPYAIGKNIQEGMKVIKDEKADVYLIYKNKKTGETKEYPANNYPWNDSIWTQTWEFADQHRIIIEEGIPAPIHDFSITTIEGSDYTEDILNNPGYYFFLICYDLDKTNKNAFGKINDFVKLSRQDSLPVICLTATSERIESFKKETGTDIDFYVTDGTQLKTMIRSNPGLMLLKQGTVIDMWHYHSIPAFTDVKEKYFGKK